MSPYAWLADQPLKDGERLYLVVSAASDANPIGAFHRQGVAPSLLPIWSDTPYADWDSLMPYLAELQADERCLQWIAETTARDWGWLAVSAATPEAVRGHLRSLTQVYMPGSRAVFFRFWDGRHLLPVLDGLGEAAGNLIPVFRRYLINGLALDTGIRPVPDARAWPWWHVPEALLAKLSADDPSTLANNVLLWLREAHPDHYGALPEACLRAKVTHFVRRHPGIEQDLTTPLLAWLNQEIRP